MTTCHGGLGHVGEDRDLNSHIEDAGNIDDTEGTNSSGTMIAFRESDGYLSNLLPNSQADLNILQEKYTAYDNEYEAGEGQPVERIGLHRLPRMGTMDSLSHSGHNQLQPQHPQSYLEKWCTNTLTHCAPHKSKQIS